jgi:hypothetical protein
MTRLCHAFITASTLTLFIAGGVLAQADAPGKPIRFSVGVVAESSDNRDATEFDKQDNVDYFLRPRLDLYLGDPNSLLDFYYAPALRYRTEPGDMQDETDFQHHLGVDLRRGVSERLRLRLNDYLSVTDDPQIEENGSVVRGDQSYVANTVEAGLNYDLFRYSNLDLQVRNRIRRFDEEAVAALSDEDETSVRIQHRRSLTPTLRTLLTGEYRMYSFEETPLYTRDFDSVVLAAGLENSFTENVIGSLSVGWQTRDHDDEDIDVDDTPYVRADISGQLNPDLRVGAVAGYGIRDSDAYPYPSQEYTEFSGFTHARITQKLLLKVAGTYRLSTYEAINMLPGGDENVLVGDIELAFNVIEAMSLMVGYRVEDIDADDGVGASYTKNSARVGATLSF